MANTSTDDQSTQVLGWHDSHCASVALLSGTGRIVYAAAEERFTKYKLQKGYPARVFEDIQTRFGDLDVETCYTDMPLAAKMARNTGLIRNSARKRLNCAKSPLGLTRTLLDRFSHGRFNGVAGVNGQGGAAYGGARKCDSLCEHHTAHAAGAYYLSGFDKACVITIDGVGDCLSGTVFEGEGGRLALRRAYYYNELTVGADYEVCTAMLGFDPDRHCGKVTGLAARGRRNDACVAALKTFLRRSWQKGRRNYFDRIHGAGAARALAELRRVRESEFGRFSRADLAWAIQHLSERRVLELVRDNVPDIAHTDLALAGGVFANVRINQKVKELGFRSVFILPPMDDGGLSLGAALHHLSRSGSLRPRRVPDMFVGPDYDEDRMEEVLGAAGVSYRRVDNPAYAVARLIADGKVVARFDGRMEFGPRALGNRSILYGASDPTVNDWLNRRLGRSEFMPFAPATLAERAEQCYEGLAGCEHTAEFMTITFDCTEYMKRASPAVVHVDGTARAQLVRRETNPGLYEILDEYRRLTGVSSIVNTSFNMHEAPIVATPEDAVRAFQQGRLDYLAMGPFLVKADPDVPEMGQRDARRTAWNRQAASAVASVSTLD